MDEGTEAANLLRADAAAQFGLWGDRPSVLDKPVTEVESVTLTVVNQSPNYLLVVSHGREIQCGGKNPYFRGVSTDRRCAMRVPVNMASNPFAVPIVTLTAYYPSGDPSFPRAGRVIWTDENGKEIECRNSFSENCAIEMGTLGGGVPPTRGNPRSKTVTVKWATGGNSAVASAMAATTASTQTARCRGSWVTNVSHVRWIKAYKPTCCRVARHRHTVHG